jgi:hypothetical protein
MTILKGRNSLHRVLDAEDDSRRFREERAEGRSSESLFSPLIRYAVRIHGRSSGSFLPSTFPRNKMFRKGKRSPDVTKTVLKKLAKMGDKDKETPSDFARYLRFLDARVLDRGLSGLRSGSPEGSWGMTTAQQGGDV